MATPGAATQPGDAPIRTLRLDRCLACGSHERSMLAMRYEFRGARFPLVECRTCGIRFLAVQPAGKAFEQLYSAEYFQQDYRCGRSDNAYFDERAFRAEDDGLLDAFAMLRPPGRLLEVGSAGGWLLKHAAERGWQVEGVEVSADGVAHARELGLTVFHGDLLAAARPAASFDVVYLGDVLEHVPDCRSVLAEVRRVLAPGGFLYLRGPITTHSLARSLGLRLYALAGRTIVLREPPYHLWEFRPRPLERLCQSVGLDVLSIHQTKIPPGRVHSPRVRRRRSRWARSTHSTCR